MHMQLSLLGSWIDAAVIMSQDQAHYAFVHLFPHDDVFWLEVTVLQDTTGSERDALISELAYAVTRLDRDMWEDTPVQHDVVVCLPKDSSLKEGPGSMIELVSTNWNTSTLYLIKYHR
jgi:hypothetical protein